MKKRLFYCNDSRVIPALKKRGRNLGGRKRLKNGSIVISTGSISPFGRRSPSPNPQVRLFIDLRDRSIQRSLAEVRPDRQMRFLNDVSLHIFDRLQAENLSKVFQGNARGSGLDVIFSPTVEAESVLVISRTAGLSWAIPPTMIASDRPGRYFWSAVSRTARAERDSMK